VWMAPAWQEKIARAAQKSLALRYQSFVDEFAPPS
jgi:hypothetical protein